MMILFSKKNCTNCAKLKKVFDDVGIEYEEKYVIGIFDLVKEYGDDKFLNISSFPIIKNGEIFYDFESMYSRYHEPLLHSPPKYSLYPIQYPDIYEMYKKARASYWQPEEITYSKDMNDWKNMSMNERVFISHILAFFAGSDAIVNENINANFESEICIPEAKAFYTFQSAIESVHSETYSIILDKFVDNKTDKKRYQEAIHTMPSVRRKADWCFKYMQRTEPFATRLVAFACVEGIYFSGSFCALYWLKKRNLLPGITFSNELISRDEGLHTEFAVLIYSKLKNKLNQSTVHEIISTAVKFEKEFIIESLPCKLIGMNAELMSQYIEFVADRLCTSLKYEKIYYSKNPFDFMENISLEGKTNFFEKRVGEYAKASVMHNENNMFALDCIF